MCPSCSIWVFRYHVINSPQRQNEQATQFYHSFTWFWYVFMFHVMLEAHCAATRATKIKQNGQILGWASAFLFFFSFFWSDHAVVVAPHALHQPSLVAHSVKPGFIGEALSVSSRSHTSTEVAASVKAGGKVKPGRCRRRRSRRRTKTERKGARRAGKRQREREALGRKLKNPEKCWGRFNIYENWSLLSVSVQQAAALWWQLARFVEFGRQCSGSVVVTSSAAVIGTVFLKIHTLFCLQTP